MSTRQSRYPVLELIRDRWSPRAMSGEPISHEELYSLFEAARWAPSSYNNQPWSFVYALRTSPAWATYLDLLVPQNQVWAERAAVLICVVSRTLFFYNDKPSRTHSFDTGAAVENLALQGASMGLVVHGMEGFDYEKARQQLKIPPEYAVEAMFAVGKPGPIELLPKALQGKEVMSDRKPFDGFVFQDTFGNS